MSGHEERESAPGRHRFKPGRLRWTPLPSGGHYPFGLRAAKAEVLHRIGLWDQAASMLESDLAASSGAGLAAERARCLLTLGVLCVQKGDNPGAEEKISEAAGLFQASGDREGAFSARMRLARLSLGTRRYELGERLNEELMEEARLAGDRATGLQLLKNRGMLCMYTGRSQEAIDVFEQTIEAHTLMGDLWSVSHTLGCIGNVHFDREDYRLAADFYERSARLCRRVGNVYSEYHSLYNLALCLFRTGQKHEALERYRQILSLALRLDDRDGAKETEGYISELEEHSEQDLGADATSEEGR